MHIWLKKWNENTCLKERGSNTLTLVKEDWGIQRFSILLNRKKENWAPFRPQRAIELGKTTGSEPKTLSFSTHQMALSRHLLRRIPSESAVFRHFSTASSPAHRPQHEFVPPNPYINSWKTPRNPKEAAKQLALLRRDYDRKLKEIRKEYINEMEVVRLEKLRKDEARKEALRIAKEERAAAKTAKKKADATDRHAAEQEFRQMLVCQIPLMPFFALIVSLMRSYRYFCLCCWNRRPNIHGTL